MVQMLIKATHMLATVEAAATQCSHPTLLLLPRPHLVRVEEHNRITQQTNTMPSTTPINLAVIHTLHMEAMRPTQHTTSNTTSKLNSSNHRRPLTLVKYHHHRLPGCRL